MMNSQIPQKAVISPFGTIEIAKGERLRIGLDPASCDILLDAKYMPPCTNSVISREDVLLGELYCLPCPITVFFTAWSSAIPFFFNGKYVETKPGHAIPILPNHFIGFGHDGTGNGMTLKIEYVERRRRSLSLSSTRTQ